MSAHYLFVFYLWSTHNIDKTHLHRIIFSIFLSNLRVESPITNNTENNIFEGMTHQFVLILSQNNLNII